MIQFKAKNIVYLIHSQLAEKLYGKASKKGIQLVAKVLEEKKVDLVQKFEFKFLHQEVNNIVQAPISRQAKTNQINTKVLSFVTKTKLVNYWSKVCILLLVIFCQSCTDDSAAIERNSSGYFKVYGVVEKNPFPDTTGIDGRCIDLSEYEPYRIGSYASDLDLENKLGVVTNNEEFVYFVSAFYEFGNIEDSEVECTLDGSYFYHYRGVQAFNDERVKFLYFEPDLDFFDCLKELEENSSDDLFFFTIYLKPIN